MCKGPNQFLRRFVTVDETSIDHNAPKTIEKSGQWISMNERAPKKAEVSISIYKVMTTVLLEANGVLYVDHLWQGTTITGKY